MNTNKENKKYYGIDISFAFGNLNFDYWEFEVIKLYKKTAKVKTILELGCTYEQKVKIDYLDKCYLQDKGRVFDHWKTVSLNTLNKLNEEIKGFTKLHKDYNTKLQTIEIMKKYIKLLDNFSTNNYNKTRLEIKELLIKNAKYKIGDKVQTLNQDEKFGIIEGINGNLHDGFFGAKISYSVKYENGNWSSSRAEKDIKLFE